jgi:hypothetical protein
MIDCTTIKAQGGRQWPRSPVDKPEGANGGHRTPQGGATAHVAFRCDPSLYGFH